jgi:hypothetical protein
MLSTTNLRSASAMRSLDVPACGRVALPSTQVAGSYPWHVTGTLQAQPKSVIFADKRENLENPSSGGIGVSLS